MFYGFIKKKERERERKKKKGINWFKKKKGINWFVRMIGFCELLFLENCIGTVSCILIY